MPLSLERMRELRKFIHSLSWDPQDLADVEEALDASIVLARAEAWLDGDRLNRSVVDIFSVRADEGPTETHITIRDQSRDYSHLGDFGSKNGAVSATERTLSGALSAALDRAEEKT